MQSKSSRILKNTLLLYVRQIVVLAIGLFTTRLTLQVLGVTDYGVYNVVAGFTTLLSVMTTTLSSGTQRYITFELGRGDVVQLNKVYITSVNIQLILSCVLMFLGETVGLWFVETQMTIPEERLTTALWVYQIAIVSLIIGIINSPNDAEIIAHEDMGVIAVISVAESVLRLAFVVALIYISYDKLIFYALALLIIQCLKRIICYCYCRRNYIEVRYRWIIDKPIMKSMFQFSGWTGLMGLSTTGFTQGVTLLLNIFWGPTMNAAHGVAMQAYLGIRNFCSNFQLASNPQIVKSYAQGDLERLNNLLYSVCKMSFFLVFALSLPFVVNAETVMKLWLGDVPEHATTFFVLLLIYAYIDVFAYPLNVSMTATGEVKWYSIINSMGCVLPIPFAYVCFKYDALPETVYYIAILLSAVFILVRLIFLRNLIRLDISRFIRDIVMRILTIVLISVPFSFLLKSIIGKSLLSLMANFIIIYIFVLLMVYTMGLNHKEKALLRAASSTYRNRFKRKGSEKGR